MKTVSLAHWSRPPAHTAAAALLVAGIGMHAFADASGSVNAPSSSDAPRAAVIHFADLGGIEDWRALRDGSLLIEGKRHTFYVATFHGPCLDLRSAEQIGFVTDASGSLTRFDSILVRGHQCTFRSLTAVGAEEASAMH
jgi:hypothetical protein